MKMKAVAKSLPTEVANKFSVIPGFGIGECQFKGQTIHLDKLTLDQAEELVKNGFNVLVAKTPATPSKG